MKNGPTTGNQTPMETRAHQLPPAPRLINQRSMQEYSNDPPPLTSTSPSYTRRSSEASIRKNTYAHYAHAALSHTESRTVPPGSLQTLLEKDRRSWIISRVIMLKVQWGCIGTITHVAPWIRRLIRTRGFAELLSHFDSVLTVYGPSLI
jgi:hypothetical protein